MAGAWEVRSNDPRFGGVSALALDHGALIALTDSGGVARFPKPGRSTVAALIREIPGGPGSPRYKSRRDSEALLRDPAGRGWWIAFEKRNELWLFDRQFARPLKRVELGTDRWPRNTGIEALASEGDALLILPEAGDTVLEVRGPRLRTLSIENPAGRISDSVRLPSGGLIVVNRRLTPLGFVNSIAVFKRTATGFRYGRRIKLRLAPLDNVEALAAEQLADGRTRLWIMTDNNFRRPFRTLLLALDMPGRAEARLGSGGFGRLLGDLALQLADLGLSLSSLVFSSQLSRPPTCSTERRPWVETRSLTLWPSAVRDQGHVLQIGQERALGLVIGVGNIVAHLPALAGQLANPRHGLYPDFERARGCARKAPPVSRWGLVRQCGAARLAATEQPYLR